MTRLKTPGYPEVVSSSLTVPILVLRYMVPSIPPLFGFVSGWFYSAHIGIDCADILPAERHLAAASSIRP
ncbi:hypothetical protein N657DRAFT_763 [Parathielavia appendiculata]|uniref:Uncharacterized protein n=1 Tax=Parathielavia appendiculata TaxID=2587402 RepID=A0AAN6Z8C4_9PEZI|nr:hypothetical protein N657DRAFT_763 [Parathielavia appendiculata]